MSEIRYFSEIRFLESSNHLEQIDLVSMLSEKYKFTGSLVYYSHSAMDPWMITMRLLSKTEQLVPLIAIQPYAFPPFTVSKMVSTIATLYKRKVSLNLITGVSEIELQSVNEGIDPEVKFSRLEEYGNVIRRLFTASEPISYLGHHYNLNNFKLAPRLPVEFIPEIFIAGSSTNTLRVAHSLADTILFRPEPIKLFREKYSPQIDLNRLNISIRVCLLARPTTEEAWQEARRKFPTSRTGELITRMRKNFYSQNTKEMAILASNNLLYDGVYWMGAYLSGLSTDFYLVGSYSEVANYLKGYIECGVNTILFGDVFYEHQFEHVSAVIRQLELSNQTTHKFN